MDISFLCARVPCQGYPWQGTLPRVLCQNVFVEKVFSASIRPCKFCESVFSCRTPKPFFRSVIVYVCAPIAFLPTTCCILPIAYYLSPVAYCLSPSAYCLLPLPTAKRLLPIAYLFLPLVFCLLSIAYGLLPFAFCLLPICLNMFRYCPDMHKYCQICTIYKDIYICIYKPTWQKQTRGTLSPPHPLLLLYLQY